MMVPRRTTAHRWALQSLAVSSCAMGNLGTQYALAYTNLSLTEVVSSSLTVVGGASDAVTLCCMLC